jgi:hypothetical protein
MEEQAGNVRELCSGQTWDLAKSNGYNGYLCRDEKLSEGCLRCG